LYGQPGQTVRDTVRKTHTKIEYVGTTKKSHSILEDISVNICTLRLEQMGNDTALRTDMGAIHRWLYRPAMAGDELIRVAVSSERRVHGLGHTSKQAWLYEHKGLDTWAHSTRHRHTGSDTRELRHRQ